MAKINSTSLTDTPAYKLTNGIYRWLVISLLWLLCSIPVVTMGAASCAALGEFSEPEHFYQHELVTGYFQRFRHCFVQGTILWLLFLGLLGLLIFDVTFYRQFTGNTGWGLTVGAIVVGNLLLGYVRFGCYRIASGHKERLGTLLRLSGKLMVMCLPVWAVMAAGDLVVLSMLIRVPYLLVLLVLLPGIYANVHCMLIQHFMRRYKHAEDGLTVASS